MPQDDSAAGVQTPVMPSCDWHGDDEPIDVDDTPSCQNCQRLLTTRLCESCGKEFLDWEDTGFDDIVAAPCATSRGDLCCHACIGSVERDIERAEDEGYWYEPDDVP